MWKLQPIFQYILGVSLIIYLMLFLNASDDTKTQLDLKQNLCSNNLNASWCKEKLPPSGNLSQCKIKSREFGLKLFGNSSFQRISNLPELFFVYSAYFDKERDFIRILSIGQTRVFKFVKCRLIDEFNQVYHTSIGTTNPVSDDVLHRVRYNSNFIICNIPPNLPKPKFISIASISHLDNKSECRISNILEVQYPREENKYEFVACVKPAYNLNNSIGLVEWIEFNKLMGIEHFAIYVLSMSKETRCLLKSYGKQIKIRKWNPPLRDSPKLLLENAHLLAINDCLYKYKGKSKYILFSDIDEFIVPNATSNFQSLVKSINEVQNITDEKSVAYYEFLNGFFFKCWPDYKMELEDGTSQVMKNIIRNMVLAKKNQLTQPFSKPTKRTKYFAQTANTDMAGVHFVLQKRNGTLRVLVSEKLGYSHHYRVSTNNKSCRQRAISEDSARKFVSSVARGMSSKLTSIANLCNISAT